MTPRRHTGMFVAGILLLGCATAAGQDLLRLFIPGDQHYRLMGGNPFAPSDALRGTRQSGVVARYDYRFDNYYKEKRHNGSEPGLSGESHSFFLLLPLPSDAQLGVMAHSRQTRSTARNTPSQQANYDDRRKSVQLTYEMPLWSLLRWNVVLGTTNASAGLIEDIGTGVSFRVPPAAFSFHLERSAQSQQLDVDIAGVKGVLPLEHRNLEAVIGFNVTGPVVHVSIKGSQAILSHLPGTSRTDELQFAPGGIARGFESLAQTSVGSSWKTVFSVDGLSFRGHGTFTSRGSRYALLQGLGFETLKVLGGVMKTTAGGSLLVADFTWQRVSGSFDGYAESWPFLSFFESAVPVRGHFRASGRFEFQQLHVGGLSPLAGWLDLGGGLTAIRIHPALRIESWQPGFLGIGQKAYQDRRLSVDRLDGVMFSSGLRIRAGRIHLAYAVTQFVPITIRRATPGGTRDLITSAAPGEVLESGGGQFHKVSVEWRL